MLVRSVSLAVALCGCGPSGLSNMGGGAPDLAPGVSPDLASADDLAVQPLMDSSVSAVPDLASDRDAALAVLTIIPGSDSFGTVDVGNLATRTFLVKNLGGSTTGPLH